MKVLIIIPCYNEEKSIRQTVEGLKMSLPTAEFIVVNDGSRDGTYRVCAENNYPVVNLIFNMGLASAVQTGMRYAYLSGYDMALQFDGDGQHLPEYIPDMVGHMIETSADIVVGSRYLHETPRGGLRGLGGSLLRAALRMSTGRILSDPTSGMRLYNRKMIGAFAEKMNYGPEPDTLAFLINQGVKVVEIPVTMRERAAGTSYLHPLAAARYMLRMAISILFIQWFRKKEASL